MDRAALEIKPHNNVSLSNEYSYYIYTKIFPDGDDSRVIFGIKNKKVAEIFYVSSIELFYNEKLIKNFSPLDVREISYTAAWEIFLSEKYV